LGGNKNNPDLFDEYLQLRLFVLEKKLWIGVLLFGDWCFEILIWGGFFGNGEFIVKSMNL
jgi:hypothetical protein